MAPRPIDVTIRGKNETKPGFDSAVATAKDGANRIKDAIAKPFDLIKGFLAVQAVQWFGEFAKSSVESAAQADAAMGRVESAVTNAGISFKNVRGDLDALFTKIQQTTRYSDDDAASAFATLVNMTGDYAGSIKNLTLATDIAAAKQIDLQEAATLVGKVMTGNGAKAFKQFGIDIKDGAGAIDELRAKVNGFAERDANTLQGQIHKIANGWDNVKEAVGRALQGATDGEGLNGFANKLNDVGKWIDDHGPQIHAFFEGITRLLKEDLDILVKMWNSPMGQFLFAKPLAAAGRLITGEESPNQGPLGKLGKGLGIAAADVMGYGDGVDEGGDQAYYDARNAAVRRKHTEDREARDRDVEKNRKQAAAAAAERAQKAADDADKKHIADLKQEYDLLEKTAKLVGAKADDYEKMAAIEGELTRLAFRSGGNTESRAAAIDFVSGLRDKRQAETDRMDKVDADILGKGDAYAQFSPGSLIPDASRQIYVRATAAALPVSVSSSNQFARGAQTSALDGMGLGGADLSKIDTSLGTLDEKMKSMTGGSIAGFFGAWQEGISDVISGHESLGAAVLKSAKKAIGGTMAAEGQQTLYKAAIATIEGLTNPAKLMQGAQLFAVGSAELAAAAVLSGGGSGSGSGPSGGGGGISAGGFQQSQNDVGGKGKATVILKGKSLSFTDPESLDSLAAAIRELGVTRELEFIVEGD